MVRNHGHFLGKAVHMVGFLGKIRQRNEQREVAIVDAGFFDAGVHQLLDAFPNAIAPWPDDHAAAHATLLGHLALGNHLLIPGGKIIGAARGERVANGRDFGGGVLSLLVHGAQR